MEKEVIIERFNGKGQGLALLETGAKVEVSSGIPGDHLLVALGKKRRGFFQSSLKQILRPSEDRISAHCVHVPECGGCSWQQMSYPAQLKIKQAMVEKLYHSFSCPVEPILACQTPWGYRNKMEFSFSQNKEGERFLGLILARTKGRVFNLKECALASPWVATLVTQVRKWWEESGLLAYFMPRDEGSLRTLIIREGKRTGQKMVMLTVSGNPAFALSKKQLSDFIACVRAAVGVDQTLSLFLRIQQQIKGSPTQFFEMHLAGPDHIEEVLFIEDKKLTFKISPTSFFQPNTTQAEVLYTTALQMIDGSMKKRIYDLYCGTGTLGMALASQAEEVIGIEINPHAIFDAQSNLERNHISHVRFLCGDVGEKLAELPTCPDLVVVDPPRAGLSPQAIKNLIQCQPKEILYISCNPATQVENIRELTAQGYSLIKLQPVDQFPHTVHIENIALLRKYFS